jgi:hypothetical protein
MLTENVRYKIGGLKMKKIILGINLVLALIFLTGCIPRTIAEVKNEQYVGKTVMVIGTVGTTIKIGQLSGYTISDSTGNIGVKSDTLPVEGSKITVTGILAKDSIFGYYIIS